MTTQKAPPAERYRPEIPAEESLDRAEAMADFVVADRGHRYSAETHLLAWALLRRLRCGCGRDLGRGLCDVCDNDD